VISKSNIDGSRVAEFSDDMAYRYSLLIRWDDSLPLLASIGLNPSTADEFKNDPTIARDVKRAATIGFGSLLKLNLFSYRSTDPAGMKAATDPCGEWPYTVDILASANSHGARMIVACWGNHGTHRKRSHLMRVDARNCGIALYRYELNKSGEPCHPLYKPYSLRPTEYEY
jgi:hypothetical protein